MLSCRHAEADEEVAAGIRGTGGRARALHLDVTDGAAFEAAVRVMLLGIARNRACVVFLWEMRLLWWLDRACPALADMVSVRTLQRYRVQARK